MFYKEDKHGQILQEGINEAGGVTTGGVDGCGAGAITTDMSYSQFLAIEYFTLTITMMLGAWYGIWLGLYWYEKVYEEKSHRGLVHHIAANYFPNFKPKVLENRMAQVKERLEENLFQAPRYNTIESAIRSRQAT